MSRSYLIRISSFIILCLSLTACPEKSPPVTQNDISDSILLVAQAQTKPSKTVKKSNESPESARVHPKPTPKPVPKTRHSKSKTAHSKSKTAHSKSKTAHSKSKTTHSKSKTTKKATPHKNSPAPQNKSKMPPPPT